MITDDPIILCITLLATFFGCLMFLSSLASRRSNLITAYNLKKKMDLADDSISEEVMGRCDANGNRSIGTSPVAERGAASAA